MKPAERIFDYGDYRVFLSDCFQARKQSRPGWSYQAWARQLGLKSPSTLVMILKKRRNPSPDLVAALCRHLQLGKKESAYLSDLVRLERAKSDPAMQLILMDSLRARSPQKSFRLIDPETFSLVSKWHYYAIRELVLLPDFQEDPEWIVRKLRFKITLKEARQALDDLVQLGLLVRDEDGRIRQATARIDTSSDLAHEGLKRFHEQALENARQSIRSIPPEGREVSGSTVAIRSSDLPRAKEMIRKFRSEFCRMLEESAAEERDAVFQLEVAFHPLSRETASQEKL